MTSLLDNTNQNDPQIDESKNYLEDLVGEGKKYKDAEALAKSKLHADMTIANREKELKELRDDFLKLREEHMAGMSQDKFLDQMKTILHSTSREPQTQNANDEFNKAPPLDTTQLKTLISEEIRTKELTDRQTKNFNEVMSKLQEHFGNNRTSVLQKRLEELDLSIEDADALARKSPKAFFNTVGLLDRKVEGFEAPFQSEQRSGFKPNSPARDRAFYEKMKKDQPALYWDPKTQNQMIKDGDALGINRFFGISP